ncbi:hypothetical protein HPB52_023652 [Rhipicephalus sanguineus]|uniref:Myb/SANT-like DNA-binding domain-containing protein n=1 Tax=Rhipicephalus sanguineus TaxID=34632 RepID=A0A9D4T4P4_RHISA|nr:hypothetical protein HPB52_023652 [Rhipicephalus sanguineus]
MWTAIAGHETGIERTPLQCENRLKTVKKRYSNARKHSRQSGVIPVEVPYAEEMSKLAAVDYSVFPEVMRAKSAPPLAKRTYKRLPLTTGRVLLKRVTSQLHRQLQSDREPLSRSPTFSG